MGKTNFIERKCIFIFFIGQQKPILAKNTFVKIKIQCILNVKKAMQIIKAQVRFTKVRKTHEAGPNLIV